MVVIRELVGIKRRYLVGVNKDLISLNTFTGGFQAKRKVVLEIIVTA